MSEKKTYRTIDFECAEESRKARLSVEFIDKDGARQLTSMQCDNPKLQSLEHWQCKWSCWEKARRILNSEP